MTKKQAFNIIYAFAVGYAANDHRRTTKLVEAAKVYNKINMPKKKRIVVTSCNPDKQTLKVIRRFNTVRQAETWICNLKSPKAMKKRVAGLYGIY